MVATSDRRRRWTALEVGVAAAVVLSLFTLLIIAATQEGVHQALLGADTAGEGADPRARREALEAARAADPHQVRTLEALARLAREEGRWLDAAQQWAEIAKLDPSYRDARYQEALNLDALGDWRGVVEALAAAELPGDAAILKAKALLGLGRQPEAQALVDRVMASEPDHAGARQIKANLLFLEGNLDAAEAAYRDLEARAQTRYAGHLGLVQVAMRRGDPTKAEATLNALPLGPDAPGQYLLARGDLLRQFGDLEGAMASYQALATRLGAIPDAAVPLAELAAAKGQPERVEQWRRDLLGTNPPALAARHYLEAIAAYLRGDLTAALQGLVWSDPYFSRRDLYRWIALDAGAAGGDLERVRTQVQAVTRDQTLPAAALVRAADALAQRAADFADRGDQAQAEALLTLAQDLSPERPAVRLVQARTALVAGRLDEASRLAEALIGDPATSPDGVPGALEVLGRVALARDQHTAARDAFDRLATALPDSAIPPYWQGVAAFRRGDAASAADLLRGAYARNRDPRIESALMDALLQTQALDEAQALGEALTQGNDAGARGRGWAYQAGVARARGDRAQAAAAYRKALGEDPRLPYALATADLLIALADYPQAGEVLAAAALKAPEDRVLNFKRAYLAQLAGDLPAAAAGYRKLLAKAPNWPLPMVNLSEVLMAQRETQGEALDLARRAVQSAPKWVAGQWNLAQCLQALGRKPEAWDAATAVLALDPSHAGAKALLEAQSSGKGAGQAGP